VIDGLGIVIQEVFSTFLVLDKLKKYGVLARVEEVNASLWRGSGEGRGI